MLPSKHLLAWYLDAERNFGPLWQSTFQKTVRCSCAEAAGRRHQVHTVHEFNRCMTCAVPFLRGHMKLSCENHILAACTC